MIGKINNKIIGTFPGARRWGRDEDKVSFHYEKKASWTFCQPSGQRGGRGGWNNITFMLLMKKLDLKAGVSDVPVEIQNSFESPRWEN